MAQIDGAAGEQMRGADRRERDADRADREAGIGQADDMHGDGVGIGGERLAAQGAAPGLVLPPGGAVGPPCAVAAGAGGVERGAAGEFGEFGGAGGTVRQGERAEQVGLQGQRSIRRRGPGRRRAGDLRFERSARAQSLARLAPDHRSMAGSSGSESVITPSLEHLFSVRKAHLSDGTLLPGAHGFVRRIRAQRPEMHRVANRTAADRRGSALFSSRPKTYETRLGADTPSPTG